MPSWAQDAVFYHMYPLGLCGAPRNNDRTTLPVPRLNRIHEWIDHLEALHVNALYLGPLFESSTHGYDTVDYFTVDRRLGTNGTLASLVDALHSAGIRVVLDGVFNHVGRDFWAFRDVREQGQASPYCDWFHNLRFGEHSPYGDPFAYDGWNGHHSLVKLNLQNLETRRHLFEAVETWVDAFDIDGLRLDAADCIECGFLRELANHCRRLKPDFWLMGEVLVGDYRHWIRDAGLDSVTNYICYKGLHRSLNDGNYFDIAYELNRLFGPDGIYHDLPLYTFADNHDVNRVASDLAEATHLYPLYIMLFTMPGIPSLYYGSEWGLTGKRTECEDLALRPSLQIHSAAQTAPQPELAATIARLADIHRRTPALCQGSYRQLHVSHRQMAYMRQAGDQTVIVALNASDRPASLELEISLPDGVRLNNLLAPQDVFEVRGGKLPIDVVHPRWGRILRTVQK